jgi:hypothetical protein
MWEAAWRKLGEFEDIISENETTGDVWQYKGTHFNGKIWYHLFLHENHPATNRREKLNIPVSTEMEQ